MQLSVAIEFKFYPKAPKGIYKGSFKGIYKGLGFRVYIGFRAKKRV